ncbi:MAG: MFS transporter [Eggerthellaceae bacterium]
MSYLLMAGHLAPTQPRRSPRVSLPRRLQRLSYTEVAFLVFASMRLSRHPALVRVAGRPARTPWLMALGMFLAGVGLAGVGLLDSYPLIIASAMLSGLGVAMFHPEGGRLANLVAGKKKGSGMSIFAVGGNLGFAVGPMLAVAGIGAFGLQGTFVFLVPSTVCAIVFLAMNGRFSQFGLVDEEVAADPDQRDHWGLFALVMAVLSSRSIIYYAITAYAALFIVAELGQAEAVGSIMITVFATFSAVATVLSGRVAGRGRAAAHAGTTSCWQRCWCASPSAACCRFRCSCWRSSACRRPYRIPRPSRSAKASCPGTWAWHRAFRSAWSFAWAACSLPSSAP